MGKGNLGVGEAAWASKLGIDPSQLNNPEKHVRRAEGCYVDAKRPGAALRRKNTCGGNTSASQCPESWWVKLVWTLVSQPGSSLTRQMSLGMLLWVSLRVFIVEQGKYLPRGNHVGSNWHSTCATSSGCSYAVNTYSVPSCLLSSEEDRTLLLRPSVHSLACGRYFIHTGPRKEQIIVSSVCVWVIQLCPTLCHPMDSRLPGFSVHGILQSRILEWVPGSFPRGSSRPRDQTQVSHIAGRFFTIWTIREASIISYLIKKNQKHREAK